MSGRDFVRSLPGGSLPAVRRLNNMHLDPLLLAALLAVIAFRLVVLFSALGKDIAIFDGQVIRILLALTIMLVDERRPTVGVLRLIGLPTRRILLQLFIEGVLIATAGSLFGLVLALGAEGIINRFFQWRYDTALVFVRVTPEVAAVCVAIAVPLGVSATVVAAWTLLRRNGLSLARR